jgi:hypothetical protein
MPTRSNQVDVNKSSVPVNVLADEFNKPNSTEIIVEEQPLEQENQITIDRVEMGIGWVCFEGGETPPPPDQLPLYLNDAIANWLRSNSEFKVTTTMPLVVNGNTVAINIWFE